jgi:hypothetical protein
MVGPAVVEQIPGQVPLPLKQVLGQGESVGIGVAIGPTATVAPAGEPCSNRCRL